MYEGKESETWKIQFNLSRNKQHKNNQGLLFSFNCYQINY